MEPEGFTDAMKSRTVHLSQLTKIYNELERLMMSTENCKKVNDVYIKLCDRYELYKTAYLQCVDLCEDSAKIESLETNFTSQVQNFAEFGERYEEWKKSFKTSEEDCISVNTHVSNASSSRSSISQMLNAKARRLIAEQKLIKLKEKQLIEREQRQLEERKQLLDQQSEIDQAKIEESVWQDYVTKQTPEETTRAPQSHCATSIHRLSNDTLTLGGAATGDTKRTKETCGGDGGDQYGGRSVSGRHSLDVSMRVESEISDMAVSSQTSAKGKVANSDVSSIDVAFNRLASTLQEGFNLPKPELLTFNGSAIDYCKFIKNFETNVESKICDNRLRLSYLIQYCTGEAKCCIEDCVLLESDVGYVRAREILQTRYGRPHVIARSYIEKLVYGSQIKASDSDGLSRLALDMQKCEITLSQLGYVSDIDNTENLRRIVKRLPLHLRTKWVDVAHTINVAGKEPRFSDLVKFVNEKSQIACSMYALDLVRDNPQSNIVKSSNAKHDNYVKGKVTTFATRTGTNKPRFERKCYCCLGTCTDLSNCKQFSLLSLADRRKLIHKFKLCYNCLKGKHMADTCRKPNGCEVPECNARHSTLLHSWVNSGSDRTVTQPSVNCAATSGSCVKACLGIVPVTVKGKNGGTCQTYALLDDGADKTLCDERLLQKLNELGRPVTFKIATVSSTGSTVFGQEIDLDVSSASGVGDVHLTGVWTVKRLPITTKSAARKEQVSKIPHLSDVDVPDVNVNDVMLLIGTDSPDAHVPLEVRAGASGQPYAVRTRLGWAVRGPVDDVTDEANAANVHFVQSNDVTLQHQLEKMWSTDFADVIHSEEVSMSVEDKRALAIMESTLVHEPDGHYKMGLPWREENTVLPNNLTLAHVRLQHLRRKLSHDPDLHEKYTETVSDYIDKGYARMVDSADNKGAVWYLPHHPVINENKPGKVRVVFDCAAKYRGTSLNKQLLQGPDLTNSLVGVLTRFRQEKIALMADIEAMFHQVRVIGRDCNALRFLWWPNGDMMKVPNTYCMQVHLFGATSSPSCSAYALKRTAEDNAHLFEPEVVKTVKRNFYVDDCLKSVDSEQRAIKLVRDLQSIMKKGGFRLTKWISNSRAVLSTISESERAQSVVNLAPGDILPSNRALGVTWNIEDDTFSFKVKIADKPLTRRGMVSVVSSIFDPLGFVSPVTLRAKAIVQKLCKEKIGWDEEIPDKYRDEWKRWLDNLPHIEDVAIRRGFRSKDAAKLKQVQLHVFCDGSELGYGACAYLRLVDENDLVSCSLVLGKARLAPMKQLSIPRMELSGAVVACRIKALLYSELDMKVDQTMFWTDSTILLGYINNKTRRFKTFVGNRLSVIHECSTPEQWQHVESSANPADVASRGIDPSDTIGIQEWLYGPKFLYQNPLILPSRVSVPEIPSNDVEVKKEIVITTVVTSDALNTVIDRYSDWEKLQRAFVWLLRFQDYCRSRYLGHNVEVRRGEITVNEIRNATRTIIEHVQRSCFIEEIGALKKGKPVKKESKLLPLNPIFDDGFIRVAGRRMHKNPKLCPIVLPSKHHLTKLIIVHYHKLNGHVGMQQVLATLREKFWILHGPSTVKSVIRHCLTCQKHNSPLLSQQMAPLLEQQTTPDKPPFSFVGIDYFGPLNVKQGRTVAKRYGVVFTCLTTRAVHFEVAQSLTTDSFLSAFQRFINRRGKPEKVHSDNGTNLVGGDREMRRSIQEWNQINIGRYMTQREIEWTFNPPYASHRGGAWERLIRSARSILRALTTEQLVNDEQLTTLMTEAEKIMNDRPITQVSNDPTDPQALTPSMLLLMKSNSSVPPGIFRKEDQYAKRWWRQTQYIADIFWKRWTREYLPSLQSRQKWQRPTRDVQEGDLVLVADDNTPRGQWPLGRVIKVNGGRDGHIRSCVVRTRSSESVKPITKLCLLEGSD